MTNQAEVLPTDPKRIKTFATFFKNYMSLSSLVVAALPIPVTSFSLIPTFKEQTRYFSVYTSLFCFLVLAYVFYSRHTLARLMFRNAPEAVGKPTKRIWSFCVNSLPPIFIILSLLCVYGYHCLLSLEINMIRPHLVYKEFNDVDKIPVLRKLAPNPDTHGHFSDIEENITTCSFETLDMRKISDLVHGKTGIVELTTQEEEYYKTYQWLCAHGTKYSSKDVLDLAEADMLGLYDTLFMILYYLGIFLFAEASFILMAIKEYLQEVLGLDEKTLIKTR